MPSRPQANPSDVPLADRVWAWAIGHPGTSFLLALVVTGLLYLAGVFEPLDWWGTGIEVR